MVLAGAAGLAQEPLRLKIPSAPKLVQLDHSYNLSVEIRNVSGHPLLLSDACALSASLSWSNSDGSGGGTGHGCGFSSNYDPGFYVLQPGEVQQLSTILQVPQTIHSRRVRMTVSYKTYFKGQQKFGLTAADTNIEVGRKIRLTKYD